MKYPIIEIFKSHIRNNLLFIFIINDSIVYFMHNYIQFLTLKFKKFTYISNYLLIFYNLLFHSQDQIIYKLDHLKIYT